MPFDPSKISQVPDYNKILLKDLTGTTQFRELTDYEKEHGGFMDYHEKLLQKIKFDESSILAQHGKGLLKLVGEDVWQSFAGMITEPAAYLFDSENLQQFNKEWIQQDLTLGRSIGPLKDPYDDSIFGNFAYNLWDQLSLVAANVGLGYLTGGAANLAIKGLSLSQRGKAILQAGSRVANHKAIKPIGDLIKNNPQFFNQIPGAVGFAGMEANSAYNEMIDYLMAKENKTREEILNDPAYKDLADGVSNVSFANSLFLNLADGGIDLWPFIKSKHGFSNKALKDAVLGQSTTTLSKYKYFIDKIGKAAGIEAIQETLENAGTSASVEYGKYLLDTGQDLSFFSRVTDSNFLSEYLDQAQKLENLETGLFGALVSGGQSSIGSIIKSPYKDYVEEQDRVKTELDFYLDSTGFNKIVNRLVKGVDPNLLASKKLEYDRILVGRKKALLETKKNVFDGLDEDQIGYIQEQVIDQDIYDVTFLEELSNELNIDMSRLENIFSKLSKFQSDTSVVDAYLENEENRIQTMDELKQYLNNFQNSYNSELQTLDEESVNLGFKHLVTSGNETYELLKTLQNANNREIKKITKELNKLDPNNPENQSKIDELNLKIQSLFKEQENIDTTIKQSDEVRNKMKSKKISYDEALLDMWYSDESIIRQQHVYNLQQTSKAKIEGLSEYISKLEKDLKNIPDVRSIIEEGISEAVYLDSLNHEAVKEILDKKISKHVSTINSVVNKIISDINDLKSKIEIDKYMVESWLPSQIDYLNYLLSMYPDILKRAKEKHMFKPNKKLVDYLLDEIELINRFEGYKIDESNDFLKKYIDKFKEERLNKYKKLTKDLNLVKKATAAETTYERETANAEITEEEKFSFTDYNEPNTDEDKEIIDNKEVTESIEVIEKALNENTATIIEIDPNEEFDSLITGKVISVNNNITTKEKNEQLKLFAEEIKKESPEETLLKQYARKIVRLELASIPIKSRQSIRDRLITLKGLIKKYEGKDKYKKLLPLMIEYYNNQVERAHKRYHYGITLNRAFKTEKIQYLDNKGKTRTISLSSIKEFYLIPKTKAIDENIYMLYGVHTDGDILLDDINYKVSGSIEDYELYNGTKLGIPDDSLRTYTSNYRNENRGSKIPLGRKELILIDSGSISNLETSKAENPTFGFRTNTDTDVVNLGRSIFSRLVIPIQAYHNQAIKNNNETYIRLPKVFEDRTKVDERPSETRLLVLGSNRNKVLKKAIIPNIGETPISGYKSTHNIHILADDTSVKNLNPLISLWIEPFVFNNKIHLKLNQLLNKILTGGFQNQEEIKDALAKYFIQPSFRTPKNKSEKSINVFIEDGNVVVYFILDKENPKIRPQQLIIDPNNKITFVQSDNKGTIKESIDITSTSQLTGKFLLKPDYFSLPNLWNNKNDERGITGYSLPPQVQDSLQDLSYELANNMITEKIKGSETDYKYDNEKPVRLSNFGLIRNKEGNKVKFGFIHSPVYELKDVETTENKTNNECDGGSVKPSTNIEQSNINPDIKKVDSLTDLI